MTQTRGHETLESRKMTISVTFKFTLLISHYSEPLRSTKEQSVLLSSSCAPLLVEVTSASISWAQYLGDILIPCSALKMATAGLSFHSTYTVFSQWGSVVGPIAKGSSPPGDPSEAPRPPRRQLRLLTPLSALGSPEPFTPSVQPLLLFPQEKRAKHSLAFNYMHLLQINLKI